MDSFLYFFCSKTSEIIQIATRVRMFDYVLKHLTKWDLAMCLWQIHFIREIWQGSDILTALLFLCTAVQAAACAWKWWAVWLGAEYPRLGLYPCLPTPRSVTSGLVPWVQCSHADAQMQKPPIRLAVFRYDRFFLSWRAKILRGAPR